MSNWISVDKDLPATEERLISGNFYTCEVIVFGCGKVTSAIFSCGKLGGFWHAFKFDGVDVTRAITHWMPLPEPPKEGEQ